jgi:hypothetical protein
MLPWPALAFSADDLTPDDLPNFTAQDLDTIPDATSVNEPPKGPALEAVVVYAVDFEPDELPEPFFEPTALVELPMRGEFFAAKATDSATAFPVEYDAQNNEWNPAMPFAGAGAEESDFFIGDDGYLFFEVTETGTYGIAALPASGGGDVDFDGDGIPDDVEDATPGLDPNNPDSDGDGYYDGFEQNHGSSPTDGGSTPMSTGVEGDVNFDGASNAADLQSVILGALGLPTPFPTNVDDTDGQGVTNAVDVQAMVLILLSN